MKTKVKPYGDEVTHFYDKEIPKVECNLNLFSSNQLGFCSQERSKILPVSTFEIV